MNRPLRGILAGCSNSPPAAFSHRSTLNVEEEYLGDRKHWRGFSVRHDLSYGRTAHTKCGLYLLGPSLAAALLGGFFEHPAGVFSCCTTRADHRSSSVPT